MHRILQVVVMFAVRLTNGMTSLGRSSWDGGVGWIMTQTLHIIKMVLRKLYRQIVGPSEILWWEPKVAVGGVLFVLWRMTKRCKLRGWCVKNTVTDEETPDPTAHTGLSCLDKQIGVFYCLITKGMAYLACSGAGSRNGRQGLYGWDKFPMPGTIWRSDYSCCLI